MPVEFLTDEEAVYGAYQGVPGRADLEKLFFLAAADRRLIALRAEDRTVSVPDRDVVVSHPADTVPVGLLTP